MKKVGKSDYICHSGKKPIAGIVISGLMVSANVFAEEGVADTEIRPGTVLNLDGRWKDACNDW